MSAASSAETVASAPVGAPTGLVTFLFTDIEGSTRLWEEFAEAMRMALARHDVLLRQTLVSVATQEACGQTLPEGASLVSLGEFALKDLPQPQAFYQLIHPSLRSTFPALRTVATQETVPSIAVLPFVNMSRDEENEYFADGLSEELLNVLAKIKGFRVASRTSARTFKGEDIDIPSAAQQLQVANVLAGSVRKAGNRVRISTQLVEAAKDETLWAETYDRELDDIFAVQDDIAQSVVKELRERLLGKPASGSEA